jgi:hypothetical protein
MTRSTTYAKDIQAPAVALPNEAQDRAEVIGKDDRAKPTAVDETRDLENFLFLLQEDAGSIRIIQRDCIRIFPSSSLVDL